MREKAEKKAIKNKKKTGNKATSTKPNLQPLPYSNFNDWLKQAEEKADRWRDTG